MSCLGFRFQNSHFFCMDMACPAHRAAPPTPPGTASPHRFAPAFPRANRIEAGYPTEVTRHTAPLELSLTLLQPSPPPFPVCSQPPRDACGGSVPEGETQNGRPTLGERARTVICSWETFIVARSRSGPARSIRNVSLQGVFECSAPLFPWGGALSNTAELPSSLIADGDCGGVGGQPEAGAARGRCVGGEERGAAALLAPAPTARAVGAQRRVRIVRMPPLCVFLPLALRLLTDRRPARGLTPPARRAAVLALKAMLVLTAPPAAEAYNICTCQCCYSGICIDRPNSEEWNGTFQVRSGGAARLQPRPRACGSPYVRS
jgi:hypothetical protein